MRKVIGGSLVCLALACGGPEKERAAFLPSEENERGMVEGAEEPASADPGTDPDEVSSVTYALVEALPPVGWRSMSPSTTIGFAARSDPTVTWGRNIMLVYGGRLADGSYSNELAAYDPNADNWIRLTASPLSPRSHAVAVWTGNKMYVFGGRNSTYRHMSSGGVFVPVGTTDGRWYTIRSAPHILKCDEQGVWSPATQEMIVFGCTGSASSGYVAGGMAYHTVNKVWRDLPAPPFAARVGARVVWAGGKMVVFGGGDPVTKAPFWDGGEYDPVSNSWEHINAGLPREQAASHGGEPRLYAAVGLTTGRYLDKASFWGGRPADDATAYDDGATYTPAAAMDAAWSPIPSPGPALPDANRRYVSAWYGADRLFIWGGQRYVAGQERVLLGSGALWDPRLRSWSPLAAGGPSPRALASALWNGSEGIVFGGFDLVSGGERLLADGMIYRPAPRDLTARKIAVGYHASCAFVEDGAVECWGMSYAGSFAVQQSSDPRRPYVMRDLHADGLTQMSLGGTHGCVLAASGAVRCWGNNLFGPVGVSGTGAAGPVVVPLPRPARHVAAGGDHSCAVLDDGQIYCWGNNYNGQLGNGATAQRGAPGPVTGITSAVKVSAGGDYTCALLEGGAASCWGNNLFGKLGDGTTVQRLTPVAVTGLTDIVDIQAGGAVTCALKRGGTVHCWGSNAFGALGQGMVSYGDHPSPLQVRELTDAVQLAVGSWFACALRPGGQPVCWGDNAYGQLGDGTKVHRTLPTPVLGLTDIAELSAGYTHGCARDRSGNVSCWGENRDGQLGDGTNVIRYAPRPVLW